MDESIENRTAMTLQQTVTLAPTAKRIFLFEEVYPFRAAQEQAEKKKLGAFGVLAKWNPLNRPKEDTVKLSRQELRLEPFWHVVAQRSVDYTCQLTYPVTVHNRYALSLQIDGRTYEVARQADKGRIELPAIERCHRKIHFTGYMDGLRREAKPAVFENYINKYKFSEHEHLERPEIVTPLLPLAAAMQTANAKLNGEAVNAQEIVEDKVYFERAQLYLRPVFAFEFVWSSADKRGVIEVDGLTGEVVENGQWFRDKLDQVMTRETLFDLGAEVAGSLVPGGGVAVKLIGKMTEPPNQTQIDQ